MSLKIEFWRDFLIGALGYHACGRPDKPVTISGWLRSRKNRAWRTMDRKGFAL